jgi:alanine racemase
MPRPIITPTPSADAFGDARPETVTGPVGAPSHLLIDLDALAANWRTLRDRANEGAARAVECAAAVKADAYGLGLARVAPTLAAAGCRRFFVAHPGEALELRVLLPEAEVHVLHGPMGTEVRELSAHRIVPVLNDLGQIARWQAEARRLGRMLDAVLHVDSGMNRLGLPEVEVARLEAEPERLAGLSVVCVMSHLSTADEPARPEARAQLARFRAVAPRLPAARLSLANSAGTWLGPEFAFDIVRPGISLYGGRPFTSGPNPMAEVVRLRAGILQVRQIDAPGAVGYGATHSVTPGTRVATAAAGYADGFLRAAGRRRTAMLGGMPVPIVGRVSMDLITLDVTGVPEELARPGATLDLIGGGIALDDAAEAAGTISYELLTSLGGRYARHYLGGA